MARADLLFRLAPLALLVIAGVSVARRQAEGRRRVLGLALLYLLLSSTALLAVQGAARDYFWTAVFLAGDFLPGSPGLTDVLLAFTLEHIGVALAVALLVAGSWTFANKSAAAACAVGVPVAMTMVAYAPFWWRIAADDQFRHSPWVDPPGTALIVTADFAPSIIAAAGVLAVVARLRPARAARNGG